jgi:hypothetical protein
VYQSLAEQLRGQLLGLDAQDLDGDLINDSSVFPDVPQNFDSHPVYDGLILADVAQDLDHDVVHDGRICG